MQSAIIANDEDVSETPEVRTHHGVRRAKSYQKQTDCWRAGQRRALAAHVLDGPDDEQNVADEGDEEKGRHRRISSLVRHIFLLGSWREVSLNSLPSTVDGIVDSCK